MPSEIKGSSNFDSDNVGIYTSVAIIADQQAYNVVGGSFTSGAWRTRDLNTEISDVDGIVSIASNQFTLQAGTYTIEWSAPAYAVKRHNTRLYNINDSSVEQYSSTSHAQSSGATVHTHSIGEAVITISGVKTFEIQHRCASTYNTYGLGLDQYTDSTAVSIFTRVKILKHS